MPFRAHHKNAAGAVNEHQDGAPAVGCRPPPEAGQQQNPQIGRGAILK